MAPHRPSCAPSPPFSPAVVAVRVAGGTGLRPVTLDEIDPSSGTVVSAVALPTAAATDGSGGLACLLPPIGATASVETLSLSFDENVLLLPCFGGAAPGDDFTLSLGPTTGKVCARITGDSAANTALNFAPDTSASYLRACASVDGQTRFWTATNAGVRYWPTSAAVPSANGILYTATSSSNVRALAITGANTAANWNFTGGTLFGLLGATTSTANPGGVLGLNYGLTATAATPGASTLILPSLGRGDTTLSYAAAMAFVNASALYVGATGLGSGALHLLLNTSTVFPISGGTWTNATGWPRYPAWTEAAPGGGTLTRDYRALGIKAVAPVGTDAVYVLTGYEGGAGGCNCSRLLSHTPSTGGWAVVAASPTGDEWRSLARVPVLVASSATPTNTQTATRSNTKSNSKTPTQTQTVTSSLTASPSGTASQSATPSGSLTAGVSASTSPSQSPSPSVTPSSAPWKFAPTSIVVLRLNNGAPLSSVYRSAPLFLDEYVMPGVTTDDVDGSAPTAATPSLVRTVPLPASSGNYSCTGSLAGPTFEGGGSLSFDGRYLVLPCQPGAAGALSVFAYAVSGVAHRQVARVSAGSDVTLTAYADSTASNLRGATSADGAGFWVAVGGGIRYITPDAASGATVVTAPATASSPATSHTQYTAGYQAIVYDPPSGSAWRAVGLAASTAAAGSLQLLGAWSRNATDCGLFSLGVGAPTTPDAGQPTLQVSGAPAAHNGGLGTTSFTGFTVQDVGVVWAASDATGLWKVVAAAIVDDGTGAPRSLLGQTWSAASGYPLAPTGGGAGVRYITGRPESVAAGTAPGAAATTGYVVYALTGPDAVSGETFLLRHVTVTDPTSPLASSVGPLTTLAGSGLASNKWWRGVYLAPCDPAVNGPCAALYTPTPWPTASRSRSATPSPTASLSSGLTASITASTSLSATGSGSVSQSVSPTRSGTPATTPSRTVSISLTATRSNSKSATPSPSTTKTGTPSPSASRSVSGTASQSPSATASASVTGSATESVSGTPPATGSPTGSASPTRTRSPSLSGSASPSDTGTPSPSGTRSGTPSPSRSGTGSASPSGTATPSPSSSHSSAATSTPSASPPPSAAGTPPASATASPPASPSGSKTRVPTSSPSRSRSRTRTRSSTRTRTRTSTKTKTKSA
jgi:hypothetical protein